MIIVMETSSQWRVSGCAISFIVDLALRVFNHAGISVVPSAEC